MTPVSGVTASTMVYGVLGWPVRHSLSPLMQTAAFASCGIDACYLAFEVSPDQFATAVEGAYRLGFRGLNVTVPHKRSAFEAAVEKDVSAQKTGAANTLVRCETGWKAYNTDIAGFAGAVRDHLGFSPEGKTALILGAGGASRAAVVALLEMRVARVLIAARDRSRAEGLAVEFGGVEKGVAVVGLEEAPGALKGGDLLVSATPLGLDSSGAWPWQMRDIDRGVLVYDMAYKRGGETSLVLAAMEAGLKAQSGRMMLVLQGAEAFSLWTGMTPPVDEMAASLAAN